MSLIAQFIVLFALITIGWNRQNILAYRRRSPEEPYISTEFSDLAMSLCATMVVAVAGVLILANTAPLLIAILLDYDTSSLGSLVGLGLALGLGFWLGKWVVYLLFCWVNPEKRQLFWLIRCIKFVFHQVAGPVGVMVVLYFVTDPQSELLGAILIFGTAAHFMVDLVLHMVGIKKVYWSAQGVSGIFLIVTQTLAYIMVCIVCRGLLFFRFRYTVDHQGLASLSRGNVIVAANHRSWWDVFNSCMVLPPSVFLRLVPFRFMTKDAYVTHLWQKIFMVTFGAFAAKQEYNKRGLEMALCLMRKKHTIFLFPEGRIIKKGIKPEARVGVAYLAQETGAHVLPIYTGKNSNGRGLVIRIGAPLVLKKKVKDLQPFADSVLNTIYSLK